MKRVMDCESRLGRYKSGCMQQWANTDCIRASKASRNGIQIHTVQLVL